MKKPQKAPISLRLSDEMEARLENCAKRTKQKKHALAQAALEAAVEAIEKNDYRIVLPIEFDVRYVAAKKSEAAPPAAGSGGRGDVSAPGSHSTATSGRAGNRGTSKGSIRLS